MKFLQALILFVLITLFSSCLPAVDSELPKVTTILLATNSKIVIPPNIPQITSKEALLTYVDSVAIDTSNSYYYHYSDGINHRTSLSIEISGCDLDSFTVHVIPTCKEKISLPEKSYPNGMSITLYRYEMMFDTVYTSMYYKPNLDSHYDTIWYNDSSDYTLILRYDTAAIVGKPLILTDGYSSLADSSYENTIIMPLRNSATSSGEHPITDWSFEVLFPFEVRYF